MEKKCFKCEETKSLSQFYKHRETLDGHLNKCKDCSRKDAVEHRKKNLERIRHYDRNRPNHDERVRKNCIRARASGLDRGRSRRYEEKYPEKSTAHTITRNAIRDGRLKTEPCVVCGNDKAEAHHEDYSRPLDVLWLCKFHHALRHRELNAIRRGEISSRSPSILDVVNRRGA